MQAHDGVISLKRSLKQLLFASLTALLILSPAYAYTILDYYGCTREYGLIQALTILDQSPMRGTVQYLVESRARITFKNMREFGKAYRDHDALSIISNDGHHLIYINIRHANAPPQALAALISHEAMHADPNNSIQEEFMAWSQEAKTWNEMLARYPQLRSIKPQTVPLVDRLNAVTALANQNQLRQQIESNIAYRDLPQRSPGF